MKKNSNCIFFIYLLLLLIACDSNPKITFSTHVAPIVQEKCTSCHYTNGIGRFALSNYKEVSSKANSILAVVKTHFMPPWPADTNYTRFVGEKVLTQNEIKTIETWISTGMSAGDTNSLYLKTKKYSTPLGKPDLTIKMKQPYSVKGNNQDHFILMKFPYEIASDTFIRAIEFVPQNTSLVHHVNGFMIQYDDAKKQNVFDGDWFVNTQEYDYKEAYEKMKVPNDDGSYPLLIPSTFNYLPGVESVVYPQGIGGYKMKKKGAFLFRDIHYGPSKVDQYDSSYINVYYDSIPPKRKTLEIQMGTLGISKINPPLVVPANEIKTFETHLSIPIDISVLTINPHMHLLGKSFWAFAITPLKDTIPLIKIKKWDFRWQYFYTFKKTVKIPAGSTIYAYGTFDNTAQNPFNPFHPPQQIAERNGSMRTTDEMFQFIITYLPYQKGDEQIELGVK